MLTSLISLRSSVNFYSIDKNKIMWWKYLLEIDRKISNQICDLLTSNSSKKIASFIAHSGDSWFWLLGLGLLWYFGVEEWKNIAISIFLVILYTAILVFIIKILVRRERPQSDWGEVYRKTDPHSFPSGHAARGVAIGLVLLALGPNWLAAIIWVWALLLPLARVGLGVHYFFDVLAGSMIGLIVGEVYLYLT
jgi:undecaprenyl-diphosphatase